MRHRFLASVVALAGACVLLSWVAVSIACKTPAAPKPATPPPSKPAAATPKPGPAPRTAWGEPDLQGTWFVMEAVPLERSAANAGKALLTDAEVAALDKEKAGNP